MGFVERGDVPDAQTAYFGIQGTTPINFSVGYKIIATFYNRSFQEEYLSCRVSVHDSNSPNMSQPGKSGDCASRIRIFCEMILL